MLPTAGRGPDDGRRRPERARAPQLRGLGPPGGRLARARAARVGGDRADLGHLAGAGERAPRAARRRRSGRHRARLRYRVLVGTACPPRGARVTASTTPRASSRPHDSSSGSTGSSSSLSTGSAERCRSPTPASTSCSPNTVPSIGVSPRLGAGGGAAPAPGRRQRGDPTYLAYVEELRHSKRVCAFRDFMVEEIAAFKRQGDGAEIGGRSEPCGGTIAAMHNIWARLLACVASSPLYYNSKLGARVARGPLQPPCWTWAELTLGLFFPCDPRSMARGGASASRGAGLRRRPSPEPPGAPMSDSLLVREPEITDALVAAHGLKPDEYQRILDLIGRTPTLTELGIFSAMWNEHCSYKSSKKWLRTLPTTGPQVICGPGENAGVVDIGDGAGAGLQDGEPQPPLLHRALPGGGDRGRRHPARRLHHGRAADRGDERAELRRAVASEDPRAGARRGRGDRRLRQRLRGADGRRRAALPRRLQRQLPGQRLRRRAGRGRRDLLLGGHGRRDAGGLSRGQDRARRGRRRDDGLAPSSTTPSRRSGRRCRSATPSPRSG